MIKREYEKFRWFFTSAGKLVIAGKSAEQNEEIIKKYLDKEDVVMHTKEPGSPFTIIKTGKTKGKISGISRDDLIEAAIFCACFSKQWKKKKKEAEVHIFMPEQIVKEKSQKKGTFSVLGKTRKAYPKLRLLLTIQKGKLRAVPFAKKSFCTLFPGKLSKEKSTKKIFDMLGKKFSKEEITRALPAGGFKLQFKLVL